MQSPTFTFRQCVRYLRSSEMTSFFACISNLTLFMCMDPQGLALPAFKEIEARSTVFAASLEALLPMTAWRTNMLIYPSSWGWRHKTSIGNFKKGYYPNSCIAPLFLAPGERLEALTAFSNFVLHLSTQTGLCQCAYATCTHI